MTATQRVIEFIKNDERNASELAKQCGVSREYIRLIRIDRRKKIGCDATERILNGLGMSFSDLDRN